LKAWLLAEITFLSPVSPAKITLQILLSGTLFSPRCLLHY